jgi:hypothetical protein
MKPRRRWPSLRHLPLAWRLVARSRIVVADLIIDPSVEAKIRRKHGLTGAEVKQAVVYAKDLQAEWQDDPERGRRLVVQGTTYLGRPFIAYMVPLNEHDEEEGTFKLKTAIAEPT